MYFIKNDDRLVRYATSSHAIALGYLEPVAQAEGYAELWQESELLLVGGVPKSELKVKPRNWLERALGKRMAFTRPIPIGSKGGRAVYAIDFEDGTNGDYFIDFEQETVEPC